MLKNKSPDFEISNDENYILDRIEFNLDKIDNGEPFRENMELVAQLFELLHARSAIPKVRLSVFSDPKYAIARGKPPVQDFKDHGRSYDEIIRHPHFLEWMYYFLYGPSLPQRLIKEFHAYIEEIGHVTSSDQKGIFILTRKLVRDYKIVKTQSLEFLKLALESGLDISIAHEIRRQAQNTADHY